MSFYGSLARLTHAALLLPILGLGMAGCSDTNERPAEQAPPPGAAAAVPGPPLQPAHLVDPPANPRAALIAALDRGLLDGNLSKNDKLRAVLKTAGVPEASQALVFSKTSMQHRLITPNNPRAIYFSDNCYIGYVPGGLVEYGDTDPDPTLGSGFFALDLREDRNATLARDTSCLSCHESARTNSRPGFFIRSVFPDHEGHVITSAGSTNVGHDTPLAKRWGGWYVTGTSGQAHHRGNQVATEHPNGDAHLDNVLGSNVQDLSAHFSVSRYLQPTSDIVALMVLEHQVQMHNLLTQGSSIVHEQYERSRSLAEYLKEPFEPSKNEILQRVIASNANRIVKHLLFCDEIALTEPVAGSHVFTEQFRANRKQDSQARSLKDFDLQSRMFKYRCSYMVYSQAFEQMPDRLKDVVLDKLRSVLSGNDDNAAFDHLDDQERQSILAILQETGVL